MIKQFNENNVLEFNADVFVIPNNYSTAPANTFRDYKRIKEVAEANGIEVNEDTEGMIQLWFVATNDLGTDNLVRHGAVTYDKKGNEIIIVPHIEFLPYEMFQNYQEGDIIDITIPYTYRIHDKKVPYKLLMHTRLNQLGYRYRRSGRFEDIAKRAATPDKAYL